MPYRKVKLFQPVEGGGNIDVILDIRPGRFPASQIGGDVIEEYVEPLVVKRSQDEWWNYKRVAGGLELMTDPDELAAGEIAEQQVNARVGTVPASAFRASGSQGINVLGPDPIIFDIDESVDPIVAERLSPSSFELKQSGRYLIMAQFDALETGAGAKLLAIDGFINGVALGSPMSVRYESDEHGNSWAYNLTGATAGEVFTLEVFRRSGSTNPVNTVSGSPQLSIIYLGG
jgi:hypothetical protein